MDTTTHPTPVLTGTPATPAPSSPSRHAVAWWPFALAATYAILVRFYQAAGGTIGMPGEMHPEDAANTAIGSYFAGLLILLGGVACLYLGIPAVRRIPRWFPVGAGREIPGAILRPLCMTPVLVGSVFAVAHAVIGVTTKGLALLGVIDIPYPDAWLWIDETSAAWWDIAFYEPWFLALGVTMHLAVRRYLRDTGRPSVVAWVTRVSIIVAAVFAGIGIWMVASDNLWII